MPDPSSNINASVNTDGEVDLLMKWRNHDDINNTWDPLLQLPVVLDVSALVMKYVKDNAGPGARAQKEEALILIVCGDLQVTTDHLQAREPT